MKFNDLQWHDSVIKSIFIDRNSPGENDVIYIEIFWPNGINNFISFKGVYWADLHMNFGVVGDETIYTALSEGGENKTVKSFQAKWKGLIDDIELSFYEIETNSTKSNIRIIAQGFELCDKINT